MSISGQVGRRILLFSLAALLLPLVAFPAQFGVTLASASLAGYLYEIVYYGLIAFLFHRRTTLIKLLQGAAVCIFYRLALGTVFGLLIAGMYSMNLGVALSLGVVSYLPTILVQAVLTPWILKPVIDSFYQVERAGDSLAVPTGSTAKSAGSGRTSISASRERGVTSKSVQDRPISSTVDQTAPEAVQSPMFVSTRAGSQPARAEREPNGFDRAVGYIGEHGSVRLAAVIDDEGLLLANFCRGEFDPDDWAPLALVSVEDNTSVLTRLGLQGLEKLDFQLSRERVVIARAEGYCLMVVSERHDDDLLSIRINQGMEMINKFVAERYGNKLNTNVERIHVSSAQ